MRFRIRTRFMVAVPVLAACLTLGEPVMLHAQPPAGATAAPGAPAAGRGGAWRGGFGGFIESSDPRAQNRTIGARYLWQANDGEIIIVRNAGPFGSLVPMFEARTDGPYAWLNTGLYLSSNPGRKPGGVVLTLYDSTK